MSIVEKVFVGSLITLTLYVLGMTLIITAGV